MKKERKFMMKLELQFERLYKVFVESTQTGKGGEGREFENISQK